MSSDFLLGESAYKQGLKSAKSLSSHSFNEKGPQASEALYLIVNTDKPLVREKDYIPRIIPLTKSLGVLTEKSVLLITKDPSSPYRTALTEKGSPTEDVFNQIYTLGKVKSMVKDPKKLKQLFKEFDVIVADIRISKLLPSVLGETFYRKNKKVPFVIQMALPTANSQLTKSLKSGKLKDNNCEPRYVKSQLKSIVKNTHVVPSSSGTCLSIKVGYTNWKSKELIQNVDDVLKYLILQKYAPVGGLLKKVENLKSVHLKTSDSISLPIYTPSNH